MEVSGIVVAGDGRGRTIGFPTANLQVPQSELSGLARGVFAGIVRWQDEAEHLAVVNIGMRPTFAGDDHIRVELHILDFEADLYGKTLVLRLGQRLRDEQRFDSVEELTRQITKDVARARVEADGMSA